MKEEKPKKQNIFDEYSSSSEQEKEEALRRLFDDDQNSQDIVEQHTSEAIQEQILIEAEELLPQTEDISVLFSALPKKPEQKEKAQTLDRKVSKAIRQIQDRDKIVNLREKTRNEQILKPRKKKRIKPKKKKIQNASHATQASDGQFKVRDKNKAETAPKKIRTTSVVSEVKKKAQSRAAQKKIQTVQKKTKKPLLIFTLICFFCTFSVKTFAIATTSVLDTKDEITNNANIAYTYVKSALDSTSNQDFDMAEYKFSIAAERFFSSKQKIDDIAKGLNSVLRLVPGGTQVNTAEDLLLAGGYFSEAGEDIAKALEPFSTTQDAFQAIKENPEDYQRTADVNEEELTITDALDQTNKHLQAAFDKTEKANKHLQRVDTEKLPDEIRSQVEIVKEQVPTLLSSFEYFMSYSDILLEILGQKNFKRYLLLFQNNSELRPTGGFVGTYALLDLNEGKITNLKVEGPYNVDGQLTEKIHAPEALRLINSRFYMRDANWFADFPLSARKTSELFQKAGGPSVDGVISVNANVLERLLEFVGPIEMEEYGTTITAENFFEETQTEVEINYDKELNRPKKFISDLIPRILDKVLEKDKAEWIQVLALLSAFFEEKEVMIHFFDEGIQQNVENFGWSGEVKQTEKDYLMINHANIGGGKTDRVIGQKASVETQISGDGSLINTVTLTKTHNGDPSDFWTRVKNVTYTRFYVPKGSELIDAKGFDNGFYDVLVDEEENAEYDKDLKESEGNGVIHEPSRTRIYEESGKAVFGNFIGVEPGATQVVQITYKLPFKIKLSSMNPVEHYTALFQKQSGATPLEVEHVVTYPISYLARWEYLTNSTVKKKFRRLENNFLLRQDKTFAVIFSQ